MGPAVEGVSSVNAHSVGRGVFYGDNHAERQSLAIQVELS